ncbi:MAG TPA: fasciclin domain-containing protein [Mucilaginibacter sp.]|nr:fasciclin domain-containing protein [Mucilaginibacter sp.]
MKKAILVAAAFLTIGLFANKASAQTATGNALDSLTASGNYTAFSLMVRVANLNSTLEGTGPYTIFAPTSYAIAKVPSGKLDSLMKNPSALAAVVKYHIVSGKYTKADIIKALVASKDRKVELKTLDGQNLTLTVVGGKLQLADDHGNTAEVTAFDLPASNGVIHGLDGVLDIK